MISELEFKSLSDQGYNRIPLLAEAFADLETPLSLYLKLAYSKDSGKYSFLLESAASELAARQSAMHTATDNAEDIIRMYTRLANAARQSEITQEITEIVSGADALAAN